LYIPAVFLTHYGAALDEKTPLLRSQDAVSEAAVRVLRLLGDVDTQYVVSNVGWEQEFFVVCFVTHSECYDISCFSIQIDKEKYLGRPDLRHCGRTLIGVIPHRNQQTEANYFGSVPPRVKAYLADVQEEVMPASM
jgi:glutamine synthetase